MTTSTKKKQNLTSPAGLSKWVFVFAPQTKYKPEGVFTATLNLKDNDAATLKASLEAALEAAYNKYKILNPNKELVKGNLPIKVQSDGSLDFVFKKDAVIKTRDGKTFNTSIPVFDTTPKLVTKPVAIYSGSKIKVAYYISDSLVVDKVRITLRLVSLQVIELAKGDKGTGGFDSVNEGYVFEDDDAPEQEVPFEADTKPEENFL